MSAIGARCVWRGLVGWALASGGALAGPVWDVGVDGRNTAGPSAVRAMGETAADLLAEARRLSPTVERQVTVLEASDVVVYLAVRLMARCHTGRLTFLSTVGRVRYVKIEIARTGRKDDAIRWLGHELQHAIEVASASDVRDQASLERLYRRIAHPQDHLASRFETDAAIRAGNQVVAELRASASGGMASGVWR